MIVTIVLVVVAFIVGVFVGIKGCLTAMGVTGVVTHDALDAGGEAIRRHRTGGRRRAPEDGHAITNAVGDVFHLDLADWPGPGRLRHTLSTVAEYFETRAVGYEDTDPYTRRRPVSEAYGVWSDGAEHIPLDLETTDPCDARHASYRCWGHSDCADHPELGLACGQLPAQFGVFDEEWLAPDGDGDGGDGGYADEDDEGDGWGKGEGYGTTSAYNAFNQLIRRSPTGVGDGFGDGDCSRGDGDGEGDGETTSYEWCFGMGDGDGGREDYDWLENESDEDDDDADEDADEDDDEDY